MFEEEIQKLERKIQSIENHENLIVFYGSSSIRLWVKIQHDLAPLNVINLGFGGSSFEWMSYYYHRVFKDLNPAQVVIYGGDNDVSNGISAMEINRAFNKLREQVSGRYPEAQIHGMTIKPSPARLDMMNKIREANHLLRKSVTDENGVHQINIFDAMLDESGKPRDELFLSDQLHMNGKGYEIWTRQVRQYFEK